MSGPYTCPVCVGFGRERLFVHDDPDDLRPDSAQNTVRCCCCDGCGEVYPDRRAPLGYVPAGGKEIR